MSANSAIIGHSTKLSLWPAFGLGLGVAVGNGFARFSYALLLPAMREDLRWSYAEAGWLNTANALGYVVGAVSGYLLLRRVRPSRLFIFGLLLTVVTLSITGLRADLLWLTGTRLMAGVGAAWVFACGGALVAARYQASPALRGTATGLFFAGAGIGIAFSGMVVNPVLTYLGSKGWPSAWLLLGVLAALASIWPLIEARRIGGAANTVSSGAMNLHGLIPCLLAYFVFAGGYIVYMTFIFAWIRDQGMSWQFGTVVWLLLGCGVAISPFVWRRALDTWNPAITLAASCATTLLGTLVPILTATAPGILTSAGLFGLGMFIAPSSVAVLVRRTMASNQWAKGITFFTVVFAIGQAIGPIFAGWIADRTSLDASLLFGASLLGIASYLALIGLRHVSVRMA
ncbi:MAG: YbfB/YjiJ family MFS transporter [Polaromonas sp.]